ncbi:hypothetical protein GF407_12430 [candidate division KSB1 bacterium]|nr:hypothetical protein [candidate division KSB1 bacterium]
MNKTPSDLDIAQRASLNAIETLADKIGLDERYLNLYGTYMDVNIDMESGEIKGLF